MTTLRREIRQEIENILKSYNIEDRGALLNELVELFDRLRAEPPAPAGSDEWQRICAENADRERAEKAMLDRLEKALGITPNGRPEWDKIARFLIERERDNETIETFAENCRTDPFTTPKAHQIAKDPMQIKMNWIHVMSIDKPKDYTRGIPEREKTEEDVAAPLTAIEEAWQRVLDQIKITMPQVSFNAWVRDPVPLSYQDGTFRVGAPAKTVLWLENRLKSTVNRLLAGILNDPDVKVEFVARDEEER